MLGKTLTLYFLRHFAKLTISVFLLVLVIIALASYFELADRALNNEAADWKTLALVALFRVPAVSEDTVSFTVLYGAIAAFIITNRRLEVVVARAAGVSAWQFLLPACAVGLLFGVFMTTVYNPFASSLFVMSQNLTSTAFGFNAKQLGQSDDSGPIWVRQRSGAMESIIGSQSTFDGGLGLTNATAYVFDAEGRFLRRIDAPTAHFFPGAWRLDDAIETTVDQTPKYVPLYSLPTNLTTNEVKQTFLQLDSVSFWTLPGLIASARRAGVSADRYVLQFNVLLARPILLMALVLIAANVSLRFSRSRNIAGVIITGVAIGFMLYIVLKIVGDLGSGGIVPPLLAAWLPAVVATLVGVTVLLHLEDG